MVRESLRALWDEPRPVQPPERVWRDWALLGVAVWASLIEAVLRPDRPAFGLPPVTTWLLAAVMVSTVLAVSTLWRRTDPLAAVLVAFGTLIVWDVARIVAANGATGLSSIAVALVLPYALLRWGSGREVAFGLGIIVVWLVTTDVADPSVAGVETSGFFLFSAAFGASIRFHAASRLREIEQAKLRQRHELARDLHDTIGHHMSGIVIQAQAGQALGESDPDRGLAVLATIEDEATRAMTEMRTIVGVLREGADPDLGPQPGLQEIERLAHADAKPAIEVRMMGALEELPAAVGVALYRIAQESLTNVRRHARNVTRVEIEVAGDAEQVRMTIRDNGARTATDLLSSSGFGLIGMRERASLLGGSLQAWPDPDRGWVVEVKLPTLNPATDPSSLPSSSVVPEQSAQR